MLFRNWLNKQQTLSSRLNWVRRARRYLVRRGTRSRFSPGCKVRPTSQWFSSPRLRSALQRQNHYAVAARGLLEVLENRLLLASDFGDAFASYGIAEHTVSGATLGSQIDSEASAAAVQNATADGDDLNGTNDDDGVTFSAMTVGSDATITINVQGTAAAGTEKLDAWIDFDGNSSFDATTERITAAGGLDVSSDGDHSLTFSIPGSASPGIRSLVSASVPLEGWIPQARQLMVKSKTIRFL
jgi:hypothetical protein